MKKKIIVIVALLLIGTAAVFTFGYFLEFNFNFQVGKKAPDEQANTPEHKHTAGAWEIIQYPTCTETGEQRLICTFCGETFATQTIDALGHDWDDGVITCEPAEFSPGEMTYTCNRCGETKFEKIYPPAHEHEHVAYDWEIIQEPTCTEPGENALLCGICGEPMEFESIDALGHDWDKGTVTTEPTESTSGVRTYTCNRCGETKTEIISPTGSGETSFLYIRTDANGKEDVNGEYILFGSYPQTREWDEQTIAALNNLAGALPTEENSQNWTSYGYYISSSASDYMWYIDISYYNERYHRSDTYRGVYFTSYRPGITTYSSTKPNSQQDENGFNPGTVYWFRYATLQWRILKEENGTALILCENVIDSQQYYFLASSGTKRGRTAVANYDDDYYAGNGETIHNIVYDNNYQFSDIRAWLNEVFYETAFDDLQKVLIETTEVDNSAKSTNPTGKTSNNKYASDTITHDKVFLLSEEEVTNPSYGFNNDPSASESDALTRQKYRTNYAEAQGILYQRYHYENPDGHAWWWLRSPNENYSSAAYKVNHDGPAYSIASVSTANYGVVPALQIRL